MYVYDEAFQRMATDGSAYAARRVISALLDIAPIRSVVDVGCARGTWLREWQRQSIGDAIGVDGPYVDRSKLQIEQQNFVVHDLAGQFSLGRQFDLAQSLEVAEHLPSTRAESFVGDLVAHSRIVLFSAASPGQGGENHLNEQDGEYWRRIFLKHDYLPFDCIRPVIAHDNAIPVWYRYNTILYVQRDRVASLCPFARHFAVPKERCIPDFSPLHYRFRRMLIRALPRSACNQLARWNARRYPDRYGVTRSAAASGGQLG